VNTVNPIIIARQNIEEATKSAQKVHQKVLEEVGENRLAIERMHNTITLIASGTLALSITYLGYLKAAGASPSCLWLLRVSWVALLVCIVASIFNTEFHTRYVHHARLREWAQKLQAQREASIAGLGTINVVDETGQQWDHKDLRAQLEAERGNFESDVTYNKTREDIYSNCDVASAQASRITFVLGLLFLALFATTNT
jgi:hypothetical protein